MTSVLDRRAAPLASASDLDAALPGGSRPCPTARARGGVRAEEPLLVLRLRGSEEAMGRAHGERIRARGGFETALGFYPELPERLLLPRAGRVGRAIARALFRPLKDNLLRRLERERPADLAARTRAFFAALGLDPRLARYVGVTDLFQNAVGWAARMGLGPFAAQKTGCCVPACSTLAVWDAASRGGALRHARNFDYPGVGVWDEAPVLVFCTPERGLRYGFVTTRGADAVGVTAFNEAGLTLTAHTRFHEDVRFAGASVVDLGHDIIRRAATLDEAEAVARERPVASSWGLCVSSGRERRAAVLETTARAVRRVEPAADRPDHLTCANRYRHPDTAKGEVAASAAWAEHSNARERRLRDLVDLGRARGGLDPHGLACALDDHVDPDAPGLERAAGGIVASPTTVKSVVVEPEEQAIRISVGRAPTSRGPYVRVPWRWDGAEEETVALAASAGAAADGDGDGDGSAAGAPRSRFADGPAAEAYACFVEAARLDGVEHDMRGALDRLEQAIALDPRDPSYRFLAGALHIRFGAFDRALAHLEEGLACEPAPFRHGQLRLWAARAASAAGRADRARDHRQALAATTDPRLAEHRAEARAEERRPLGARKLRSVVANFFMVDAACA